jgi:hypothetical protein
MMTCNDALELDQLIGDTMSLFERPGYQWRETYFVLFDVARRPQAEPLSAAVAQLNKRFQIEDIRGNESGLFESMTVISPDDFAAMDISCVVGEEVEEQLPLLQDELKANVDSDEERQLVERIGSSTARFDVFHFEQQVADPGDSEEPDFMDPGGVLVVLERLAEICDGVVVDPQSASLL